MSNAVRHVLGLLAGLLLTPAALAGLAYGTYEFAFTIKDFAPQPPWMAAGVLAATAVVLGLLAGSRLSPIASLIAGMAYTAMAGLGLLDWNAIGSLPLPSPLINGLLRLTATSTLLVIGVLLLVASLFPARWRAKRPAQAPEAPIPAAGYQPPYPYQPPAPQPEREQPPTVQAPAPFHEDGAASGRTREFPSQGPTPPS